MRKPLGEQLSDNDLLRPKLRGVSVKISERAAQIWPVLALAAMNRQVLTYDILAQLTGVARQGLGKLLEPIQSYCLINALPPLTILVVKKDSGLPGVGFIAASDIPATQLRVFEYDWRARGCPTPEEFDKAVRKRPSDGITGAFPSATVSASERRL